MKKSSLKIGSPMITIALISLVVFGTVMIFSAEMGNAAGDSSYLTKVILKQAAFAAIGVFAYLFILHHNLHTFKKVWYYGAYAIILLAILSCRLFGETNGAYAWIRVGNLFSIQPSEFAKTLMIILGARMLGKDHGKKNVAYFKQFALMTLIYFFMILLVQKDLGSAVVLFVICYCLCLIPPFVELKKIQKWLRYGILLVIILIFIALSPVVTNFLMNYSDNYMVARFLAAANPFLYRYDNGYHIIMSLVSFANGNIKGLGYGNSIHKYMNFPNPSNDFILPVIVEELGIIGFIGFVALYAALLGPMVYHSLKSKFLSSKMIMLGCFLYFMVHFILNVGGVSGLIPLTGVPLLLISSGGSSLLSSMMSVGFVQNQIVRNINSKENNDD